jgi:hypothetical protein
MKIMLVCSTAFYYKIADIKEELEKMGHTICLPNCYGEEDNWNTDDMTDEEMSKFFNDMFHQSRNKISEVDAILVLNYTKEKNGIKKENYIGASTFLEMYEAFMGNKKIFMMNDYPDNMLTDEIKGFAPILINGDLNLVK